MPLIFKNVVGRNESAGSQFCFRVSMKASHCAASHRSVGAGVGNALADAARSSVLISAATRPGFVCVYWADK